MTANLLRGIMHGFRFGRWTERHIDCGPWLFRNPGEFHYPTLCGPECVHQNGRSEP